MKKNSMYWNHKLTKEKMFVQNKLKNALGNNKKKWNAKRFVFIIGSRDRQGSADRPIQDFQNFVDHDPGLLKLPRSWSGPRFLNFTDPGPVRSSYQDWAARYRTNRFWPLNSWLNLSRTLVAFILAYNHIWPLLTLMNISILKYALKVDDWF